MNHRCYQCSRKFYSVESLNEHKKRTHINKSHRRSRSPMSTSSKTYPAHREKRTTWDIPPKADKVTEEVKDGEDFGVDPDIEVCAPGQLDPVVNKPTEELFPASSTSATSQQLDVMLREYAVEPALSPPVEPRSSVPVQPFRCSVAAQTGSVGWRGMKDSTMQTSDEIKKKEVRSTTQTQVPEAGPHEPSQQPDQEETSGASSDPPQMQYEPEDRRSLPLLRHVHREETTRRPDGTITVVTESRWYLPSLQYPCCRK